MNRRFLPVSLVGIVVLVMLVGDPRAGRPSGPDVETTSAADVCDALDTMATMRDDLVDDAGRATVDELRLAATRTRDVGMRAPALDRDAYAGLDYFVSLFEALPARPTTQQLLDAGAPAPVTDQANADALVDWLGRHCAPDT